MTAAKCPTCGKPPQPQTRPFCSVRCANVDLQRWLTGAYAIPAEENDSGPTDESDDG